MHVTRHDGSDLRRVLAGMATDRTVCARIASQWVDGGLFESKWANLVGSWCVQHMQKYDQPINSHLQGVFESWSNNPLVEQDTVKGVERFLVFLSNEWSKSTPPASDCVLDIAKHHFNSVRVRRVLEDANEDLESGHAEQAISRMSNVGRVELGQGSLIKPIQDWESWQQAFDPERRESLVKYTGGLERFFGDALARDTLIAFMGPDKTGKSFWLLDVAYRALRNRRRVAYFEAGDLLQDEVLLRLGSRVTSHPSHPGIVRVPTELSQDGRSVIAYDKRQFDVGLSARCAHAAFRRVCRSRDLFRLSCHANSTVNVNGIFTLLSDWARDGWNADVVVIDYADILAPPTGVRESLDQIDETWKQLRRLSQESHALVVTASQSNAAAYTEKNPTLSRKHFSGRKTKLAHVNGMIGINCSDADKHAGIMRLNWVVRRNARYSERRVCVVAGCLALSRPAILSHY